MITNNVTSTTLPNEWLTANFFYGSPMSASSVHWHWRDGWQCPCIFIPHTHLNSRVRVTRDYDQVIMRWRAAQQSCNPPTHHSVLIRRVERHKQVHPYLQCSPSRSCIETTARTCATDARSTHARRTLMMNVQCNVNLLKSFAISKHNTY